MQLCPDKFIIPSRLTFLRFIDVDSVIVEKERAEDQAEEGWGIVKTS